MEKTLEQHLLAERHAAYARLRGGFPIPLSGAIYWFTLAGLGLFTDLYTWSLLAFVGSGLIFPSAVGLAALFGNRFLADRTAVTGVLLPTFIGMLLFWPMAIAALWEATDLVPLILAIGLSMHWPVIGWSYGRTALFASHAIARAAVVFVIWLFLDEARTTLLPLSVGLIYLATTIAILIDSDRFRRREAAAGTPARAAGDA
ncbi:MAG: hypothetical protein ACFB6R_06915 [Alphaproteobacteria bacterium]